MNNYNEFCRGKECHEYIEWEHVLDEQGSVSCTSCQKVGQSYDIDEYPEDCLFIDEIKLIELASTTTDYKTASTEVEPVEGE